MKPIAAKYNATLAQLVINWTINQPGIGCVLVGARNEQQVKDNVGSVLFTLATEDIRTITALADKFSLAEQQTV
jgi:aryl-alcohol dehydrogenase-like predicted oxidoreductase